MRLFRNIDSRLKGFASPVSLVGMHYFLIFFVSALSGVSMPAEALSVDCNTSNWSPSLFCNWETRPGGRCEARPGQCEYIQPIEPLAPGQTGKAFSARMLYSDPLASPPVNWDPGTDLRCADGSEPFMYVDKGSTNNNDWIFFFSGGGSCSISGLAGSDADCKVRYQTDRDEFSSHDHKRANNLEGILSHLPGKNPFASFNRVKLDKCGFNRFMGRNTTGQVLASDPAIKIQQAGFLTIGRMLKVLNTDAGNGGADFEDCSGPQCLPATLPQLCQPGAQRFIFAGHSDGAHGLIHNIDTIVQNMRQQIGCNDKDVQNRDIDEYFAVIDAQFVPMTENECKYDPAGCDCPAGLSDSIYCHDSDGIDSNDLSWDDDYFSGSGPPVNSTFRQVYADWGNGNIKHVLDQSCWDYHQPLGDEEKCADRFHVLANHISTPFFLRESLADENKEHFYSGLVHRIPWRNSVTGAGWNISNWVPDANELFFLYKQSEYAQRVVEQASDMADPLQRQYADETPLPPFRIFMPACTNHEGVAQNETFENMQIEGLSYKKALWDFIDKHEQYDSKVWNQEKDSPRDCSNPAVDQNFCFSVRVANGSTATVCL